MDIVITTIFPPTKGATLLDQGLLQRAGRLWVMGDRKGPTDYALSNARFYDLKAQGQLPFQLARLLPENHYGRKNLGYLLAIEHGATCVVETDDDNLPLPDFWQPRTANLVAQLATHPGWFNVYREFSNLRLWPRGFPLEEIAPSFVGSPTLEPNASEQECLIQQALADANPDVDAVYRLTSPLPIHFQDRLPLALAAGCWCPFNSQNTTFFPAAYPLLYLPTFCTFRMTDIWRSFVAQRCLWEMESRVCFTKATVCQERNEHNLLRDFADEIPGYLHNQRIRALLENTRLRQGRAFAVVSENLLACYEALIRAKIIPAEELPLAQAWLQDLSSLLR